MTTCQIKHVIYIRTGQRWIFISENVITLVVASLMVITNFGLRTFQGVVIMLQDSCPLTLFVFVFRGQGIHFRFKINGIETGRLQLKQDKYINHHSANTCKKLSCCCTLCSWCISKSSSLMCGLVTALTFKMCWWSGEDRKDAAPKRETDNSYVYTSFQDSWQLTLKKIIFKWYVK